MRYIANALIVLSFFVAFGALFAPVDKALFFTLSGGTLFLAGMALLNPMPLRHQASV